MKEKNGEHPFGDTGQLIALGVFLIVWIGDSFFLHLSTFLSDDIPLLIRLLILALALIVGICCARSGHVVVSRDSRPDGVVSTGAFRYIRHPLYLASLLVYLGLTIATASLLCLALFLVIFLFYNYIAGYEERLMVAKHGQDYLDYKSRTGKLIPRMR